MSALVVASDEASMIFDKGMLWVNISFEIARQTPFFFDGSMSGRLTICLKV